MTTIAALSPALVLQHLAIALFVVLLTALGAVTYRVRGAARLFVDTPRVVDLLLVSLPIALTALNVHPSWAAVPLVLGATIGAVALGHMPQINLGRIDKAGEEPNWVARVFGYGDWESEAAGLALLGFLVTLPAALAHCLGGHPIAGFLFGLAGAAKPVWYELGHRSGLNLAWLQIRQDGRTNYAAGELLFGAWLGLATALLALRTW